MNRYLNHFIVILPSIVKNFHSSITPSPFPNTLNLRMIKLKSYNYLITY